MVRLAPGAKQNITPGEYTLVSTSASEFWQAVGNFRILEVAQADTHDWTYAGDQPQSYMRALPTHAYHAATTTATKSGPMERVAVGFGHTCLKIGILIAMAAIIGKCLMDSGAAERIVLAMQRRCGERGTPLAFIGSGFTLGIPVFFDTVFYLMIPLGKALRMRTGKNYLLYVLTIVAGATMAHSLVPPTPGPLFVAEELGVELGTMILFGILIGLVTATAGYFFAVFANSLMRVPLRPSTELTEEELNMMAHRDPKELPGLFVSLLPILLPVLLLAGGTVYRISAVGDMPAWIKFLTDKNVALTLAAICGLLLLVVHKRQTKQQISEAVQAALASGGVIILITAAGGAFGHVLRQTDIAGTIQTMIPSSQAALLPLAFFVTTVIRTAQGSATVAMITAVGIMSPLISDGLSFHPSILRQRLAAAPNPSVG